MDQHFLTNRNPEREAVFQTGNEEDRLVVFFPPHELHLASLRFTSLSVSWLMEPQAQLLRSERRSRVIALRRHFSKSAVRSGALLIRVEKTGAGRNEEGREERRVEMGLCFRPAVSVILTYVSGMFGIWKGFETCRLYRERERDMNIFLHAEMRREKWTAEVGCVISRLDSQSYEIKMK